MDKRTRMLVLITLAAAGAFVGDKLFTALWWAPWKSLNEQIDRTDVQLASARATMGRETRVREGWSKIRALLDKPRTPDVHTHFVTHLGDICDKVGINFDIQGNPQPQQQGDFKEYIYETRFKLTWGQFVDLLAELHSSREFLKPLRISIGSLYEKEDRLDLDLKVSTIEYSPAPVKAGAK